MKRDLDLARQLLLDIESRGADCSVSVLRPNSEHSHDEQIRYHLRLLIDAQLLKEVDRTSAGVPCVRLTHQGHELLELARSETRWRDAKWACQDRLGGLSLAVIRSILMRWILGETEQIARVRRPYGQRLRYEPEYRRNRGAYRVEPLDTLEEREYLPPNSVRYVRVRPESDSYRELPRYGIDLDGDGLADIACETELPAYSL